MRVFVAGATGVIGRRLVPMLQRAGHHVSALTRSPERGRGLRERGVEAFVGDALDAGAVGAAVRDARPDAVVHQLTSIPPRINPRRLARDFELNDRLRSEGTRILVDAARAADAGRIVAQSIAFAYAPGPPGTIHAESDALHIDAPAPFTRSVRAVAELEGAVRGAGGTVLRYGYFYGPGSAISREGSMAEDLARRRMPIVGAGAGVWSFVHVDDAARATVAALTAEESGVFNVVDDDPAPVSQWLPALAQALGAPRPMRVPAWLARLAAGPYGVQVMTAAQGASNSLARRALGFSPAYASWREGFRAALG
jgi:nucleoside-diphosphate-sugar epimerase